MNLRIKLSILSSVLMNLNLFVTGFCVAMAMVGAHRSQWDVATVDLLFAAANLASYYNLKWLSQKSQQ